MNLRKNGVISSKKVSNDALNTNPQKQNTATSCNASCIIFMYMYFTAFVLFGGCLIITQLQCFFIDSIETLLFKTIDNYSETKTECLLEKMESKNCNRLCNCIDSPIVSKNTKNCDTCQSINYNYYAYATDKCGNIILKYSENDCPTSINWDIGTLKTCYIKNCDTNTFELYSNARIDQIEGNVYEAKKIVVACALLLLFAFIGEIILLNAFISYFNFVNDKYRIKKLCMICGIVLIVFVNLFVFGFLWNQTDFCKEITKFSF